MAGLSYFRKCFYPIISTRFSKRLYSVLIQKTTVVSTHEIFCQGHQRHPFGTKDTAHGPALQGTAKKT
jgi:hypothetical protein